MDKCKKAGMAAVEGRTADVENAQIATGLIAQSSVKSYITAGIAPALSDRTLYNRQHRQDQPNSRTTPLRDKDDLFKAINFVVRPKGS